MAAEEPPSTPFEVEEDDEFKDQVAASFASQPKPSSPCTYQVEEASYWECRRLPVGSVIAFDLTYGAEADSEAMAVMVKAFAHDKYGTWADVKFLGGRTAELSEQGRGIFRSKQKRIHICRVRRDEKDNVLCPLAGHDGTHLERFRCYPPGDFNADWLSLSARKAVKGGLKLFRDSEKEAEKKGLRPKDKGDQPARVEERLAALRKKAGGDPRVTFGTTTVVPDMGDDPGGDLSGLGAGTISRPPSSLSVRGPPPALTDRTPPAAGKDAEPPTKKAKTQKLEEELVLAASSSRDKGSETRRSRSRSKKKKKKKKKKRRKSQEGSQSSSESSHSSSSSSSRSLMAPLKRKAEKSPGSVYKMLEEQALSHLAQDEMLDEENLSTRRPKMFTYFQISLRPHLDPKSRDTKEMGMLARALDLLRSGRLTALADLLAARLIAVDTATRQGWSTARHLEVFGMEEESTAPPRILLAAQRHSRQVERAGGKGSWQRASIWQRGDWASGSDKGKGKNPKGKGKKGKNPGKWNNSWGNKGDTNEGKPKAPQGEP
eukprot:Skav213873  [mRNA]  locus=scaffold2374:76023:77657:+ [translate_table: standard]